MKAAPRDESFLRLATLAGTGAFSCALFVGLAPPAPDAERLALRLGHLLGGLSGDLPGYALRFALSALLLGLLPLGVARLLGFRGRELGLSLPARPWKPSFLLLVLAALATGASAAWSPAMAAYYPYSKSLAGLAAAAGPAWFALHAILYLLLYYLPWEIFFRGFLIHPFLAEEPAGEGARSFPDRRAAAAILLQTLPSAMLHVGHPLEELLLAVPAGLVFGWLSWSRRSLFPGLVLHAALGLGTDGALFLRAAGFLP